MPYGSVFQHAVLFVDSWEMPNCQYHDTVNMTKFLWRGIITKYHGQYNMAQP